jgi:excisionase family DNA binding protein
MSRNVAEIREQTRRSAAKQTSQLLSTSEAANYLGLSVNTVRKYLAAGDIVAYRVGKKLWKFDTADLDESAKRTNNE